MFQNVLKFFEISLFSFNYSMVSCGLRISTTHFFVFFHDSYLVPINTAEFPSWKILLITVFETALCNYSISLSEEKSNNLRYFKETPFLTMHWCAYKMFYLISYIYLYHLPFHFSIVHYFFVFSIRCLIIVDINTKSGKYIVILLLYIVIISDYVKESTYVIISI